MNIYVGNLSYNTSEGALSDLFAEHGAVVSARIIKDRETNRPKGFAFVEMEDDSEAKAAIDALHGIEVDGRSINVNEAKPRESRGGGGGSKFGGFGGFRR